MVRFAPSLALIALLGTAPAAMAGGVNLGAVTRVPSIAGVSNHSEVPGMAGTVGRNTYGAYSAGTGAASSGAGMNVTNSDGVSVQSNIDATRNVQAGSTVSVNETYNGVKVGYSTDFLAGANAQGQDAYAQRQAYIQQLQAEAQMFVQVYQGQGY